MSSKTFNINSHELNFSLKKPLSFSISSGLNFEIADYDGMYVLFKVLIDFIENYSVGDVFTIIPVIDLIVDRYG